jgi:antitoxin component YwqK of YwqJK toxin-antitoxin module
MKRSRLLFFSLILFVFSCSSGPEIRVVEETWPGGKEKTVKYYKENGNTKILVREELFYENGSKQQEGTYKNEERHGSWTYWYDNGNIWSKGEFKNGKSEGIRQVYHPNGKLYYEGEYRDGKPVGVWKFYDEEGRFIKEEEQPN